MAIAALVCLIVIHKLEYFLNARIIGTHVKASACFKSELREKGLV